jgi:hypothetical protein
MVLKAERFFNNLHFSFLSVNSMYDTVLILAYDSDYMKMAEQGQNM